MALLEFVMTDYLESTIVSHIQVFEACYLLPCLMQMTWAAFSNLVAARRSGLCQLTA